MVELPSSLVLRNSWQSVNTEGNCGRTTSIQYTVHSLLLEYKDISSSPSLSLPSSKKSVINNSYYFMWFLFLNQTSSVFPPNTTNMLLSLWDNSCNLAIIRIWSEQGEWMNTKEIIKFQKCDTIGQILLALLIEADLHGLDEHNFNQTRKRV